MRHRGPRRTGSRCAAGRPAASLEAPLGPPKPPGGTHVPWHDPPQRPPSGHPGHRRPRPTGKSLSRPAHTVERPQPECGLLKHPARSLQQRVLWLSCIQRARAHAHRRHLVLKRQGEISTQGAALGAAPLRAANVRARALPMEISSETPCQFTQGASNPLRV